MRKLLSNKWFIFGIVCALLVAIVVLSVIPNSPVKQVFKPVTSVANPVQRGFKWVGDKFSDAWAAITDGASIREENNLLREEIADLEYQLTQNEEAAIRYDELKDAFHIRDSFSNYEIFGASILSRESDEWFSVIRIGLGTEDGLILSEYDAYAVVDTRMNLIGRVIETDTDTSKVLPILHEGFTVSGKVNEVNGATVVISGDAALKLDNLCLVTGIDEDTVLEVGDEIVTSGEGGLFPQGVPIGVITSVDYSNPLNITATLQPYSNIDDLKDVFVMVPYDVYIEQVSGTVSLEDTSASETVGN